MDNVINFLEYKQKVESNKEATPRKKPPKPGSGILHKALYDLDEHFKEGSIVVTVTREHGVLYESSFQNNEMVTNTLRKAYQMAKKYSHKTSS
jgi:hypothetical protein